MNISSFKSSYASNFRASFARVSSKRKRDLPWASAPSLVRAWPSLHQTLSMHFSNSSKALFKDASSPTSVEHSEAAQSHTISRAGHVTRASNCFDFRCNNQRPTYPPGSLAIEESPRRIVYSLSNSLDDADGVSVSKNLENSRLFHRLVFPFSFFFSNAHVVSKSEERSFQSRVVTKDSRISRSFQIPALKFRRMHAAVRKLCSSRGWCHRPARRNATRRPDPLTAGQKLLLPLAALPLSRRFSFFAPSFYLSLSLFLSLTPHPTSAQLRREYSDGRESSFHV